MLGGEVELVIDALDYEARIAEHLSGSKYRNQRVAAVLAMWSRGWLARLEALHATETGNYAAGPPLVRSAADYLAASISLLESDAGEWEEWLAEGGVALAPQQHALEYRPHAFRSAETLANSPLVGRIYREATDLGMPHFGATLLLTGNESDPNRIAVTFADRDFHVGLSEIVLAWLMQLSLVQYREVLGSSLLLEPETFDALAKQLEVRIGAAGGRADRCRFETVEVDGVSRTIVSNFRRSPSSAATRILM
ncbi:MAG TPA: hypothetical protein QGF35_02805 [Dehalococcoidia bacterium]|nr:hypothetical protein [Dehalococcoidia bacterium]